MINIIWQVFLSLRIKYRKYKQVKQWHKATKVVMPIIRQAMPKVLAQDLVSVQPMSDNTQEKLWKK